MHMHGVPVYGRAEWEPAGSGVNRQCDDFSQLFLTAAPLPSHLPATSSRKRIVPAARLALLSKLAEPAIGIKTDNPDIQAGYIYLAQFTAQDFTYNLTPFDEAKGPPGTRCNARHARLVLQTLYGLGPTVHTHIYNAPDIGQRSRGTLRLG